MLVHYLLLYAGVNLLYLLICGIKGQQEDFYDWSVMINGLTSLLLILPVALWLYQRDWRFRPSWMRPQGLRGRDGIWCFLWGGAMAIVLNVAFSLLQIFQRFPSYGEQTQKMTENTSILWMILWTAVTAPLVEELICRGLIYRRLRDYTGIWPSVVISGLMFGLYHGNVVQAIYASILGCLMAILVEISGSLWAIILFHMGANLISVLFSEYAVTLLQWHDGIILTAAMGLLFLVFWGGIFYFRKEWKKRVRKTAY